MLNAYFSVQGYEVSTAAWGEDAIRLSHDNTPDLVVLDIRLPDIDGYEVCRRIRTNRRTQNTPIIFLTEKRDRVDKLAGLELGVVDYITKPFDIQELRLRVRNALNRAEQASPVNPITSMPESQLLEEEMQKMIYDESRTDWAVLMVTISGLDEFREKYGFVASDDVLRAVSLMLNNTVREVGASEKDAIGHIDAYDFVILTTGDRLREIRERIEVRLQHSMEYFYPLRDREKARQAMSESHLQLMIGQVSSQDGKSYFDIDTLRQDLYDSREITSGTE
jgi:PleD family two-component response regulator